MDLTTEQLSAIPEKAVVNKYLPKVKAGPFGLIVPLAARAEITLRTSPPHPIAPADGIEVALTDVSGESWSAPLRVIP